MREQDAPQMAKVHDGRVLIRSGGQEYLDTVENFALDAEQPFEALPPSPPGRPAYIGRTYIPGEKHNLTDGRKNVPVSETWTFGESLFPRVPELLAAQRARAAIPDIVPVRAEAVIKRTLAFEAMMKRRANDPNASQEEKDYQDFLRDNPDLEPVGRPGRNP